MDIHGIPERIAAEKTIFKLIDTRPSSVLPCALVSWSMCGTVAVGERPMSLETADKNAGIWLVNSLLELAKLRNLWLPFPCPIFHGKWIPFGSRTLHFIPKRSQPFIFQQQVAPPSSSTKLQNKVHQIPNRLSCRVSPIFHRTSTWRPRSWASPLPCRSTSRPRPWPSWHTRRAKWPLSRRPRRRGCHICCPLWAPTPWMRCWQPGWGWVEQRGKLKIMLKKVGIFVWIWHVPFLSMFIHFVGSKWWKQIQKHANIMVSKSMFMLQYFFPLANISGLQISRSSLSSMWILSDPGISQWGLVAFWDPWKKNDMRCPKNVDEILKCFYINFKWMISRFWIRDFDPGPRSMSRSSKRCHWRTKPFNLWFYGLKMAWMIGKLFKGPLGFWTT